MRPIKLLELFSGNGDISKSFEEQGGEAYRVDWSDKVEADLHADVSQLTVSDILNLCDGVPRAVWASPQCTTYSIATHRHRTLKEGLFPKTELAVQDDLVNEALWALIDGLLDAGMTYYFVENPKARMRHMPFVEGRPRYTITYCSYGKKGTTRGSEDLFLMKPTDIWTNHPSPKFLTPCYSLRPKPHQHGKHDRDQPRDYLSRGRMPKLLTDHIAERIMN